MKNKFLAIIPARGGSKRLPNKNILDLNGKPLIAYSIIAAKDSKYIDDIVVSTDSMAIKEVALNFGAEVPFLRPQYLSNDTASSKDVIEHCINYLKNELKRKYDYIILLQPTSPLRDCEDIDKAIEELLAKNADAIVSVTQVEHSPLWCNTLNNDLNMENFIHEEVKNKRSQDLETFYRLNGAIYICNIDRFLEEKTLFLKSNIYANIMSNEHSIDIDTKLDFEIAKVIMNSLE